MWKLLWSILPQSVKTSFYTDLILKKDYCVWWISRTRAQGDCSVYFLPSREMNLFDTFNVFRPIINIWIYWCHMAERYWGGAKCSLGVKSVQEPEASARFDQIKPWTIMKTDNTVRWAYNGINPGIILWLMECTWLYCQVDHNKWKLVFTTHHSHQVPSVLLFLWNENVEL